MNMQKVTLRYCHGCQRAFNSSDTVVQFDGFDFHGACLTEWERMHHMWRRVYLRRSSLRPR